jgi:hypothetical protein
VLKNASLAGLINDLAIFQLAKDYHGTGGLESQITSLRDIIGGDIDKYLYFDILKLALAKDFLPATSVLPGPLLQ